MNNLVTPKCIQRISSASTHIIPTAPLSLDYSIARYFYFPSIYLSISLTVTLQLLASRRFSLPLSSVYSIKLSSCMHTRIYCDIHNTPNVRYCRCRGMNGRERYDTVRLEIHRLISNFILNSCRRYTARTMTLTPSQTSLWIATQGTMDTHRSGWRSMKQDYTDEAHIHRSAPSP